MSKNTEAKVSIVVGSKSDYEKVKPALQILSDAGVKVAFDVMSAHRSPTLAHNYVEQAKAKGVDCIIAAAGLAAQLPGAIAPLTHIPVVGLPLTSSNSFMTGLDALLSITHMPPGVPLISGGVNGAKNVALAVLRFIQYKNPKISEYLEKNRQAQYDSAIIDENKILEAGTNETISSLVDEKLLTMEEILEERENEIFKTPVAA